MESFIGKNWYGNLMITDREFAEKLFLPNLEYKDGDRVLAFRCPYCGDDPKKKSKRSSKKTGGSQNSPFILRRAISDADRWEQILSS